MTNSQDMLMYISNLVKEKKIDKELGKEIYKHYLEQTEDEVAVIGMGCKTPQSDNYEDFWSMILNKETLISMCPRERIDLVKGMIYREGGEDESLYHKGSFFRDLDQLDYSMFNLSKEDASLMDPAQRMMLRVAFRTLEDAGYLGEKRLNNKSVGVYVGHNFTSSLLIHYLAYFGADNFEALLLNWTSGFAARISHVFDLKGPSLTIDNACTSSSTAILNACHAIKYGECEMALAGGVSILLVPSNRISLDWVFNHDNTIITKGYGENPGGCYLGEGAGMIMLKSLKAAIRDGDQIHGILKGGSQSNNGLNGDFNKNSAEDITDLIIKGLQDAKVHVKNIQYVEGEGYAEKLEEALEISGISNAFKKFTNQKQYSALGTVSANIGYTQAAAGIFSGIKALMSLKNSTIPPVYKYDRPSKLVNLTNTPFYINDLSRNWETEEGEQRCALTVSTSFGGLNVALIYQEAPELEKSRSSVDRPQLWVLSARSEYSLRSTIQKWIQFLPETHESLQDICFTTLTGREHYFPYRLAIVANSKEELLDKLIQFANDSSPNHQVYYGSGLVKKSTSLRKMDEFKAQQELADDNLNELGRLYSQGVTIPFQPLFHNTPSRICSVPQYVFDETSCWAQLT
ncbi:beta-ketoacyl synthase N-terminal-like domain-containing protein [Niallia sp. Krafla_26]|uniref:beta-ketoacyl synthase N-terminal-like domain-containing protein n=1 Tax=Niallia sp. Krafla_26 TaxID=3064703 RepID=UPI003D178A05